MSDYAEVNLSGYLLQEWTHALQKTKRLGDQSMIQLEKDEDFQWSAHEESNSIATIVSHMAGNMESRWKDLLTSDGEKESRDRDAEFLPKAWSKGQVLEQWERGWAITYKVAGASGKGSSENNPYPERTTYRSTGDKPAALPLFLSCGPNRIHSEAAEGPRLEKSQHSPK